MHKTFGLFKVFFTLYHSKSPSNHHLGEYLFTLSTHNMKIFGESTSLTATMLIRSDLYRTNRSSYLGFEPLVKTKAVKGRQVAWLFFCLRKDIRLQAWTFFWLSTMPRFPIKLAAHVESIWWGQNLQNQPLLRTPKSQLLYILYILQKTPKTHAPSA